AGPRPDGADRGRGRRLAARRGRAARGGGGGRPARAPRDGARGAATRGGGARPRGGAMIVTWLAAGAAAAADGHVDVLAGMRTAPDAALEQPAEWEPEFEP